MRACGNCSACDERRFLGWAARIRAGLGHGYGDDSPRTVLAAEVIRDLGRRHPWGIAEDLVDVLANLSRGRCGADTVHGAPAEDDEAAGLLDDLAETERESLRLDPDGPGQDCAVKVRA